MKLRFLLPLVIAAVAHIGIFFAFAHLPRLPQLLRTEPVRVRVVDAPSRPPQAASPSRPPQPASRRTAPKGAAPETSEIKDAPLEATKEGTNLASSETSSPPGPPSPPSNPCGTLRVPQGLLGQGLFPRSYLAVFSALKSAQGQDAAWEFSRFVPADKVAIQPYLDRTLRRVFEKCLPSLQKTILPNGAQTHEAEFSFPVEFVE